MPSVRRRWLLIGGGLVVLLVVVAIAWVSVRAAQAQRHLTSARRQIPTLQQHALAGNRQAVARDVRIIQREAARARSLSSGPLVRAVGKIPYFGRTTQSARGLAIATDDIAQDSLPPLARSAVAMSPERLRDGNEIRLAPLRSSAKPLADAAASLQAVRSRVLELPTGALVIDAVDHARQRFLDQVGHLQSDVAVAARFAAVAPAMLGDNGTRRYFIGVQNNAQARGTGGVLGAYAIVTAKNGRLQLEQVRPGAALPRSPREAIRLGSDFTSAYGKDATRQWAPSNQSPNFPYAAQIWAGLWEGGNPGQHIDGVIGMDPHAFAGTPRATGPVQATRVLVVNATNVVNQTEVVAPTAGRLPVRNRTLAAVTSAIIGNLFDGGGDTEKLATQLGAAASGRHLAIWSSKRADQTVLAQTNFAGELPQDPRPYGQLVVNSMDTRTTGYYLTRTFTYFADACGGRSRSSTYVVRLANDTPTKLPPWVAGRKGKSYGVMHLRVDVYATAGARLRTATIDGGKADVQTRTERGHSVFTTDVTLPRLATRTLTLHATEPSGVGRALVQVQPLGRGQQTVIDVPTCR